MSFPAPCKRYHSKYFSQIGLLSMKNVYMVWCAMRDLTILPNRNLTTPSIVESVPKAIQYELLFVWFVRLIHILLLFRVSESTWWAGVAAGIYPQPVKLSARTTAWRVEDLKSLIEQIGGVQ